MLLQEWSQAECRLFQLETNNKHNAPTMKVFFSEIILLSFFSQSLASFAGEVNEAVERINREPRKLCHATSAWYRSVKTNKNWDKHITRVLLNYIITTKKLRSWVGYIIVGITEKVLDRQQRPYLLLLSTGKFMNAFVHRLFLITHLLLKAQVSKNKKGYIFEVLFRKWVIFQNKEWIKVKYNKLL